MERFGKSWSNAIWKWISSLEFSGTIGIYYAPSIGFQWLPQSIYINWVANHGCQTAHPITCICGAIVVEPLGAALRQVIILYRFRNQNGWKGWFKFGLKAGELR